MKKNILFILFCLFVNNITAQEYSIKTGTTTNNMFYVGSLPESHNGNYKKLKIEIFGGGFINTSLGTKTYTISTRGGLVINETVDGGNTGQYALKVYKTSQGYDFVIHVIWEYASLIVKSSLSPNHINFNTLVTQMIPVKIEEYSPIGKEDITNTVTINSVSFTNQYGKMGVGVRDPKERLEVNGTILAKEVKISLDAGKRGADFVFHSDYQLRPLSEVEEYVKENKHLPEIPSEKEMLENGVSVNDLQIKLLQKIEELTLYTIQQQKQLEEQGQLIKEMKKQIDEK